MIALVFSRGAFFYSSLFAAGLTPEGSSARDLLPRVALARPADAPRAQAARLLQVPLQRQAQGGLHQPVPLRQGRVPRPPAGPRPQVLRPHSGVRFDALSGEEKTELKLLPLINE